MSIPKLSEKGQGRFCRAQYTDAPMGVSSSFQLRHLFTILIAVTVNHLQH